jgi:hypothetical protein
MPRDRRAVAFAPSMAPSSAMSEPLAPAPTAPVEPTVPVEPTMEVPPTMPVPPTTPAATEPTHPCARCGAPVPLDVGLCERCNPLGLKDSASSQVHGTVILAVGVAVAGLAIAAHLAVAGIGPFAASVTAMRPGSTPIAVVATISVTNRGTAAGTATCRLTDPADGGSIHADVVYSPRVDPGATVTFDHESSFGSVDRPFDITCRGP